MPVQPGISASSRVTTVTFGGDGGLHLLVTHDRSAASPDFGEARPGRRAAERLPPIQSLPSPGRLRFATSTRAKTLRLETAFMHHGAELAE